ATMVIASAAMLNTVRYHGYGCLTLNVHWVHALAIAVSIAGCGPSSTSDIRSAACETDSVDPLATEIGRLTFQVDVTHDTPIITANSHGCGHARGNDSATPHAPARMTAPT